MKMLGTLGKIALVLFLVVITSCSVKPQEINYGKDGCHFCSMTIVDQQHAAQIVTSKGKAFKFDAIECMVNYLDEIDSNSVAMFLCNHYTEPSELINAQEASFLISQGIPSPMGAFLTAFESEELAGMEKDRHGGEVYTWSELLQELK